MQARTDAHKLAMQFVCELIAAHASSMCMHAQWAKHTFYVTDMRVKEQLNSALTACY